MLSTTLNHLGDSWKSAREALNFAAFLFYTGFPGFPSGSFFQFNSQAVHRSGLYHLWQIPQTWPLIGLMLAFGLLMNLRKDLYVLIVFHVFVNMWLVYGAG